MRRPIWIFLIVFVLCTESYAQPFIQDVNAFAVIDAKQSPPANAVLLIGSSSFTYWKDVADYFPEHLFINRAFGGSSLTHQIDYIHKVVYPYKPKQILIYCGENDIAASKLVTADTVLMRFKTLYGLIRERLPDVPIAFVSIKPSPVRAEFISTVRESNKLIKEFCERSKKTDFINVFTAMLGDDEKPMEDIFIADRLHMNAKGYRIWEKLIAPYLIK